LKYLLHVFKLLAVACKLLGVFNVKRTDFDKYAEKGKHKYNKCELTWI